MNESQENAMPSLSGANLVSTVIAAATPRVCRYGIPHKPMKLGGDVPAVEQVKR